VIRLRAEPPSIGGGPIAGDVDGRCESDVLIVGGDMTPGLVTISKAGIPFKWDKRAGYGYSGAWLQFMGQDLSEFDTIFTIWRDDQRAAFAVWAKKYLTPPTKPQDPNLAATRQAANDRLDAITAQITANANAGIVQTPQEKATTEALLAEAQARAAAVSAQSPFLPNMPQPKALGVANPILAELGIKAIVPKLVGQWVPGTGQSRGKWTKTISWFQFRPPVPMIARPSSSIPDVKKKDITADDPQQLQIRSKLDDIKARQARLAQIEGRK